MDLTGVVKKVYDTVDRTDNFKTRDFVVTVGPNEQYPQQVLFQTINSRVALLDNVPCGIQVKVHFNISGREYDGEGGEKKYFNTLNVWRIEPLH